MLFRGCAARGSSGFCPSLAEPCLRVCPWTFLLQEEALPPCALFLPHCLCSLCFPPAGLALLPVETQALHAGQGVHPCRPTFPSTSLVESILLVGGFYLLRPHGAPGFMVYVRVCMFCVFVHVCSHECIHMYAHMCWWGTRTWACEAPTCMCQCPDPSSLCPMLAVGLKAWLFSEMSTKPQP